MNTCITNWRELKLRGWVSQDFRHDVSKMLSKTKEGGSLVFAQKLFVRF